MAGLGTLTLDLVAKIGGFTKPLDQAERQHKKTAKQIAREQEKLRQELKATIKTVAAWSAGIGAAGVAMGVAFTRASMNATAEMQRNANMAGISVEAYQELEHVARQYQVTTDALTDGMKELALRADEFAVTGAGSAAEAFQRLGYTQDEVNKKLADTPAFFEEIMVKLKDLDQAARIRILDEIFGGQAGEQLNAVVGGFSKIKKEAHDLGMVMSADLVKQTVEAKIELDNLSKVISSQFAIVVAELSPDIQSIAESMMNWVREQRALKELGMGNFFDTLADSLGRVASALSTIAKYSGLRSVLGTMSQAAELSKQGLLDMTEFVKLSFLERQKLVDDILRKQAAIAGNAKYLTGGLDDFAAPMMPEVVVTASGGGGGDKPKAPPPLPDSDPLGIWRGGPMVLNPDAIATMQDAHQRYLAIMAEMSTASTETYTEMTEASQTWVDGALAGLAEYQAAASDTFQGASDFFGQSMNTMEDFLVDFVTTGKLEFKDLIDSILSDLARLMIRQNITGPLAGALGAGLSGLFGGGGTGFHVNQTAGGRSEEHTSELQSL